MKQTFVRDFTTGSIFKPLVIFALPLFAGNFLQIAYNMVDMIIVGQINGNAGITAVSNGGNLSDLITTLVVGFSGAAQVIIAQYIGAGKKKDIGRAVGTFTFIMFVTAVVFSALGFIFRRNVIDWLNTPDEAVSEAVAYASVVMLGMVFIYAYNCISAILRGLGDSKHPFVFISIAALLNIALDILFVMVIPLGAMGAALATVASQAISFILSIIFLIRNKERLGFEICIRDFIPVKVEVVKLLKLGLPMAIKSAAIRFSMLFISAFTNVYGLEVASVNAIGTKINSIGNFLATALNTAGATMVGQNIGAEKYERVPKIMLSVWAVNIVLTSVIIAVFLVFPEQFFMLFTKDASIIPWAMEYVPVAVLVLFACSFRSGANALINGGGNYKINIVVVIVDAIVLKIGLSLLLGLGLGYGYQGFWYGGAISNFAPFFIGGIYLLTGKWKTNKYLISKND